MKRVGAHGARFQFHMRKNEKRRRRLDISKSRCNDQSTTSNAVQAIEKHLNIFLQQPFAVLFTLKRKEESDIFFT